MSLQVGVVAVTTRPIRASGVEGGFGGQDDNQESKRFYGSEARCFGSGFGTLVVEEEAGMVMVATVMDGMGLPCHLVVEATVVRQL